MQTYSQFAPTGFDRKGAFLPDRQDWLVLPVSRNRDSGPLDESNFEAALDMMGGESETVEVHRFGHWGPGWFEIILADPSLESKVGEIEAALESYPVLDEDDHSRREFEAYAESWESWGRSDYWRGVCRAIAREFDLHADEEAILEDASDEEIEGFAASARQSANWDYQPDGDGVTINLDEFVGGTDLEAVVDWAEKQAGVARRQAEIERYCQAFNLPARVIREAVRRNLDRFSAVVAICDP